MEASDVVVSESAESKQEEVQNQSSNNSGEAVVVAAVLVIDSGDHGETDVTANSDSTADSSSHKKKGTDKKKNNRIQVSNTKKPFRYIKQYNDIELSALGMAIPTVVTIAEILKRDGLASSKEVKISTVDSKEEYNGHFTQKAKIQIVMGKAEKLDKTTTAAATALKSTADTKA
ncbi:hypothetical protein JRO89_XS03G0112200 [Xanthoceras sorbifolium]|uniref:DNA/RNA-binding protein Alba-like domain-containing protein n=1 Tax=Xanthoceras sorbifolium TaxID=99658 RepID=A0ABQ8I9K9_9ROSI|nr:hypothetical protein JRO89_XS03G0112200 [Xanthoceras sorbifolium]